MNNDVALVIELGAEVGPGQRFGRRECGFARGRFRAQLAFVLAGLGPQLAFAAFSLRLVPPKPVGGGGRRRQSFRYSRSRFV